MPAVVAICSVVRPPNMRRRRQRPDAKTNAPNSITLASEWGLLGPGNKISLPASPRTPTSQADPYASTLLYPFGVPSGAELSVQLLRSVHDHPTRRIPGHIPPSAIRPRLGWKPEQTLLGWCCGTARTLFWTPKTRDAGWLAQQRRGRRAGRLSRACWRSIAEIRSKSKSNLASEVRTWLHVNINRPRSTVQKHFALV